MNARRSANATRPPSRAQAPLPRAPFTLPFARIRRRPVLNLPLDLAPTSLAAPCIDAACEAPSGPSFLPSGHHASTPLVPLGPRRSSLHLRRPCPSCPHALTQLRPRPHPRCPALAVLVPHALRRAAAPLCRPPPLLPRPGAAPPWPRHCRL